MLFQKKIPCYVLVFEQIDIIKNTLKFLTQYSDQLDIIIVENPSNNTPVIRKYINRLGKNKKIKRYYLMDKNITGKALRTVIEHEKKYILKHRYVILTDGDITVSDTGWLKEQKRIMSHHRNVFACGVSMDKINLPLSTFPDAKNWLPNDMSEQKNYYEAFTGTHLLMLRPKNLFQCLDWLTKEGLASVDGTFHRYCYDVVGMKWARTKRALAYHLTWDLYSDYNHPYTQFKLSKSLNDTWYHSDESEFSTTEY